MTKDYCETITGGDHTDINGRDLPDQGTDTGLEGSMYGADIGQSAINRKGSLTSSSDSDTPNDETIRAETIMSGGGHDTFATGSPFTADDGAQTKESTMPRAKDIHR
jgi:hypothetical protein